MQWIIFSPSSTCSCCLMIRKVLWQMYWSLIGSCTCYLACLLVILGKEWQRWFQDLLCWSRRCFVTITSPYFASVYDLVKLQVHKQMKLFLKCVGSLTWNSFRSYLLLYQHCCIFKFFSSTLTVLVMKKIKLSEA